MLVGNYYTYSDRAAQSGGTGQCRICPSGQIEDISHVLTQCSATEDVRKNILNEVETITRKAKSSVDFTAVTNNNITLTQFILDCTSLNLENGERIHINDPHVTVLFNMTRKLCHAIHSERMRKLKLRES